jgi:hypothetical protein
VTRFEYCDVAIGSLASFQAVAVKAMERVGVPADAIRYFNRRTPNGAMYYVAVADVADEGSVNLGQ